MKHKVYFDETQNILNIRFVGKVDASGNRDVAPQVNVLPEGKRLRIIVDLSDAVAPFWDRKTRQVLADGTARLDTRLMAAFGASPAIRVISKMMVIALEHKERTKFLKPERKPSPG
ncbi:hypothetical protein JXM67_12325 [candidate division WOR-3 bacterium]|nr:hypothetical protein [candidate division WOR-3 bacterium]